MTVRTNRFFWILLLSLFLACGPGLARAIAQEGDSSGSRATVMAPRAANPEQAAAPDRRESARGLSFQSDDETPEASDDGTPSSDDDADDSSASDDPADIFAEYLERTDSLEMAFGPEDGELVHDPDAVSFEQADVDLASFIVHAEFTNPYAADDNQWDIGFQFRLREGNPYFRLIVVSTGDWVLAPAQDDAVDQGTVDNLNLDAGDTNVIDLVVDGDVGYFGINGEFVSELDVSSIQQSGDVAIATAFYEGNFQDGKATGFDDFIIWELEPADATPEPEETTTAEPEETTTAEPEETTTAEPEETTTAESEETTTAEPEETTTAEPEETTTAELEETVTAEPEETTTAEPEETVTAEPEETTTAEPEETVTAEPEETTTAEPDETVTSTAGNSYESPTFGYSLAFGDDWSIDFEEVDNGVDSLRLNNGTSTVDFLGYESELTPAECVADELDYYENADGYSDVEVALDENDNELQGEFDDPEFGESAYVVVSFTYTPEEADDPTDYIAYVECRTVESGESLLKIVQFVPFDDYNDQVEARVDLLEGLRFQGAGPDETPEPEETVTSEAGDVYESPTYGFTLPLTGNWTIESQSSDDGLNSVRLANGVSTIDILAYETEFTPLECMDDEIEYYESAEGFSDAEVMEDEDGEEMRGDSDESAFAVVSFTYTDPNGDETDYVAYLECRDLEEEGTQLKIVQYAPADGFEDEFEAREELLEGLVVDGGAAEETPEPTEEPEETPESSEATLAVVLDSAGTSVVSGLATISEDGSETQVMILVSGAEDGTIAVIQEGTCDDLTGEAAFELESLDGGFSESTIDVTITELTEDDHVVTLHESDDDLDDPLACGEIAA